jgi:hypothetical protein
VRIGGREIGGRGQKKKKKKKKKRISTGFKKGRVDDTFVLHGYQYLCH